VESRHQVSDLTRGLRVLATVCKVVPAYQPGLAAAGTALDILTTNESQDPLVAAAQLDECWTTLKTHNFKKQTREYQAEASRMVQDIRPTKLEQGSAAGLNAYRGRLSGQLQAMSSLLGDLQRTLKPVQAPANEIEAELQRLEATDLGYANAIARVRELNAAKVSLAEEIQRTVDLAAKLQETVASDVLTAENLQREITSPQKQVRHSTLVWVRSISRRQRDRLLRYHNWMARAFEYRLLRPYPGDLRMEHLIKGLEAALGQSKDVLSEVRDWTVLLAPYYEQLRDVTFDILNRYNGQRREVRTSLTYDLTEKDLENLNRDNRITLDLFALDQIESGSEDARLCEVKVEKPEHITASVADGTRGANVVLALSFVQAGESVLRSGAEIYSFRHAKQSWDITYNLGTRELHPQPIAPASESLLRHLLGGTAEADSKLPLFSLPSLWGGIRIEKTVRPSSKRVRIEGLRVRFEYDFIRSADTQCVLNVSTQSGLMPYFFVSEPDLAGRRHAQGSFLRVYPSQSRILLRAQKTVGGRPFREWRGGGEQTGDPAEVQVKLANHQNLEAVYA
jgi:hypothetical protein